MAISENASLGVSRQPEPPGEFSERAYHQVSLPLHPLVKEYLDDDAEAEARHTSLLANASESVALASA